MHHLFTDGGSRGNPGHAAIGFLLFDEHTQLVDLGGRYLGQGTNNMAEYTALVLGLQTAKKSGVREIKCFLDSELVVKQLNGAYKVKDENIRKLYEQVRTEAVNFTSIEFIHVPRAANRFADRIVNTVLDAATA